MLALIIVVCVAAVVTGIIGLLCAAMVWVHDKYPGFLFLVTVVVVGLAAGMIFGH